MKKRTPQGAVEPKLLIEYRWPCDKTYNMHTISRHPLKIIFHKISATYFVKNTQNALWEFSEFHHVFWV